MELVSAEMSYQRWAPDTFDPAGSELLQIPAMEIASTVTSCQRWAPDASDPSEVVIAMLLQSTAFPQDLHFPRPSDILGCRISVPNQRT